MARAKHKLPAEIHSLHGSKGQNQGILLPENVRERIPFAEWGNGSGFFVKEKFIEETAEFLYAVYGIGSAQDRHTLMMLADHMEVYILAMELQKTEPLIVETNRGATRGMNPCYKLATTAMENCLKIMNELGLTPKARLSKTVKTGNEKIGDFKKGWMAA